MPQLLPEFSHPERLDLATGHHLRPIRESDVDIDYPAVMGSRHTIVGEIRPVRGWPPADMTYEANSRDLARHKDEITPSHGVQLRGVGWRPDRAGQMCYSSNPPGRRQSAQCRRPGVLVGGRPGSRRRARAGTCEVSRGGWQSGGALAPSTSRPDTYNPRDAAARHRGFHIIRS